MANKLPIFLMRYSDSGFTNPHELVKTDTPADRSERFSHMGAMFWGFESARHRATKIDKDAKKLFYNDQSENWMVLGLKLESLVSRIEVSTKYFTGNQVPAISIILRNGSEETLAVDRQPLDPDSEHGFDIKPTAATECTVICHHDGGIAQIELIGEFLSAETDEQNLLTYASISKISNEHYGGPGQAIQGERQVDHMLGWESARTGFGEHAVFHLRKPTVVKELIVDTYMHRLNAPLTCHLFGIKTESNNISDEIWGGRPVWGTRFSNDLEIIPDNFPEYMRNREFQRENAPDPSKFEVFLHPGTKWTPLLSFCSLEPDSWHKFSDMESSDAFTDLLFLLYPNGGIHGLKLHGHEQ